MRVLIRNINRTYTKPGFNMRLNFGGKRSFWLGFRDIGVVKVDIRDKFGPEEIKEFQYTILVDKVHK